MLLYTTELNKNLKLYDSTICEDIVEIKLDKIYYDKIFSQDGSLVAISTHNFDEYKYIKIYNSTTLEEIYSIEDKILKSNLMFFSFDNNYFLYEISEDNFFIYNILTKNSNFYMLEHYCKIINFPYYNFFLIHYYNTEIKIYNFDGQVIYEINNLRDLIVNIKINNTGKIFVLYMNNNIEIHDINENTLLSTFFTMDNIRNIIIEPLNEYFVCYNRTTILIYDFNGNILNELNYENLIKIKTIEIFENYIFIFLIYTQDDNLYLKIICNNLFTQDINYIIDNIFIDEEFLHLPVIDWVIIPNISCFIINNLKILTIYDIYTGLIKSIFKASNNYSIKYIINNDILGIIYYSIFDFLIIELFDVYTLKIKCNLINIFPIDIIPKIEDLYIIK